MIKERASSLSSYDFLKTFAVIIMIADHVGYYFFPEDLWWRAVGRIGFPIWFYLAGHAKGRSIPTRLWAGGLLLVLLNPVVGMTIFPLNALFTIIAIRLLIDPVMERVTGWPKALWPLTFLLSLMILPSNMMLEYGTLGLLFAMFGYMAARREKLPFDENVVRLFMMVIAMVFLAWQSLMFGFTMPQFILMAFGTIAVCLILLFFKPMEFPSMAASMPRSLTFVLKFCGHRTLEIYVVHLVIFKILALTMGFEGFDAFQFEWFK